MRGWAWRRALAQALPLLFPAALVVPGIMLLAALAQVFGAPVLWPLGVAASIALALAVGPLAVAARTLWLFARQRTARGVCLALYDRGLELRDRLQTADEFLQSGAQGGFERAAVEDAAASAQAALAAPPPAAPATAIRWPFSRWPLGVAAAGALAAAFLLEGTALALTEGPPQASDAALVAQANAPKPTEDAPHAQRQRGQDAEPRASTNPALALGAYPEAQRTPARPAPAGAQSAGSQAQAGARAGSDSQATAAAAGAAGTAAGEPPRPRDAANRKARRQKPKPPTAPDRKPSTSGVASGQGSSAGSRIAASDHPTVDNKARTDDVDNDVEDDAEDEEDEAQDAAASHRPMLNNRKAPVDRSLSPGAQSDQERDDLNGRGGPGGLKKTRGVAAMLLGVPAPDHLRGKANPGRMKVRRERAEPEEKDAGLAHAAARGTRDRAFGNLAHPHLRPWMQAAVRDYFLARNRPANANPAPAAPPATQPQGES